MGMFDRIKSSQLGDIKLPKKAPKAASYSESGAGGVSLTDSVKKKKRVKPSGTAWDHLQSQGSEDTLANRDVHYKQQLERGEIEQRRSPILVEVAAGGIALFVFILMWITWGVVGYGVSQLAPHGSDSGSGSQAVKLLDEDTASQLGVPDYVRKENISDPNSPVLQQCYFLLDPAGKHADDVCNSSAMAVERPQWHIDATFSAMDKQGLLNEEQKAELAAEGIPSGVAKPVAEEDAEQVDEASSDGVGSWIFFGHIGFFRVFLSLIVAAAAWLAVRTVFMKQLTAQNLMRDTRDINQYQNDQHIALPDEVVSSDSYNWFPDVGAHSAVQPSSMLSHIMLNNKGVNTVEVAKRADADIIDEEGDIIFYKGQELTDDDGNIITETKPLIDEGFGNDLFEASGIPPEKRLRKFYSPAHVPFNGSRDKYGKGPTAADHINSDWVLPLYEPQRPGGAYIVDEAPVNTMILAMTRAGKGQTYIEPMIDMWLRERRPNNIVINDPKGELLVKHYERATVRGFQVVQFNLINALKTDIYNPLALAAEAAREGDQTKCALYVSNIADVFFPVDGADDPVWPNAANNAFKRTAYGMIDYYLEKERQMRAQALREGWDEKVLETRLDEQWGKVTLYNCYQFFVQLSAKKLKMPAALLQSRIDAGEFGEFDEEAGAPKNEEDQQRLLAAMEIAEREGEVWDGNQELDVLTLFFNATDRLPSNTMRDLVGNADKALRAMGAAEKMLASVYGIAITAMSFFVDPTISTLTSGTLSQNTDLAGLSFPRRFGVRFDPNYVRRYNLVGCQVLWDAYADEQFTEELGKDFLHEDTVSREGWARYYFKGIFENNVAYLRLRLVNSASGTLIKTFYFMFVKSYQTNLSGRTYMKDPITEEKLVKNGVLVELKRVEKDGKVCFVKDMTMFPQETLNVSDLTMEDMSNPKDSGVVKKIPMDSKAIQQFSVRYAEKPKVVFLVTPPHLMSYAKLILILVKQLVDLNFDQSYMTKSNQKPLYKTRFMLDELGNLQSEGHGISGFETMLSIGLGQEQQFTLILQTLQQLTSVYGDSVDKIVQGNTANIIFLKSTDDSMIDTLQKMSGVTHKTYTDSKTITRDVEKLALQTEGKVSYTMTTKEEPVISYNDLAYLAPRNSIIFRAGDPPIWNRNETIFPMSWRLFKDTIQHYGHEYTLQTIPTLSSALEFDVRLNQPDFVGMWEDRLRQASFSDTAKEIYQTTYGYDDYELSKLDPDVYAAEVMDLIDKMVEHQLWTDSQGVVDTDDDDVQRDPLEMPEEDRSEIHRLDKPSDAPTPAIPTTVRRKDYEDNDDVTREVTERAARAEERHIKKFAGKTISPDMLTTGADVAIPTLKSVLIEAYSRSERYFAEDPAFRSDATVLADVDGTAFVEKLDSSKDLDAARDMAEQEGSRVYTEGEDAMDAESLSVMNHYSMSDAFLVYLSKQESWAKIASGKFEHEVEMIMRRKDSESISD